MKKKHCFEDVDGSTQHAAAVLPQTDCGGFDPVGSFLFGFGPWDFGFRIPDAAPIGPPMEVLGFGFRIAGLKSRV